jgi:hypothetical protein
MNPTVPAIVIPRACNDIIVVRRLHSYHLRNKLWMMAKIGIHNNDKVASDKLD